MEDENEEWEDDPWAEGNLTSSLRSPTHPKQPLIPLSDFLKYDLLWLACQLAASAEIEALRILLERHAVDLWPSRFKIINCIPENIPSSRCLDIFPMFDFATNKEFTMSQKRWRQETDFVELDDIQDAMINSSSLWQPTEHSVVVTDTSPVYNPLTAEELSNWYKERVERIISFTGMVDSALTLVQHVASQGIPFLDELGEDLSLLSRLVYDTSQAMKFRGDWTLKDWYSMDPLTSVRAYLSNSPPESLVYEISHLVMPYLLVLEARAERAGSPDPSLPNRVFHEYLTTTSLENAAIIFEASKPTLPFAQRVIKDDDDMVRLALSCLYGSDSIAEWPTMSKIFECLPVWDNLQDSSLEDEDIVASLGAFITRSTDQEQCPSLGLLQFFQPLSLASLSRALDILDIHLEAGEIFSRWNLAVPLRWFLQSAGDVNEQRSMAIKMARRGGRMENQIFDAKQLALLLGDMQKFASNGGAVSRTAFSLLSKDEVTSIFLGAMLSTGNFSVAKTMLYGTRDLIDLSPETVEDICLSSSRAFFDSSTSGSYKFGDMKLAYDCLDVPQSSSALVKEKEFIEATSRICSFNVLSASGFVITPIEIRLTKDKLSLISGVLSSNNDAYKHRKVIVDLAYKLGFKNDTVAEVKVLATLADTALQAEDFLCAYENIEAMLNVLSSIRERDSIMDLTFKEVANVCWIACFQLGRQSEFPDISKKTWLLGHAMELCPPENIPDVLVAWRKFEMQGLHFQAEKILQRRNGQSTNKLFDLEKKATSLRAKLQSFHMPSPPLLSTPDAAALATRTFKTVASSFPSFSVGHHGQTQEYDFDDRVSLTSGESLKSNGEDVSSQASRVLSKGIGWLIGAESEEFRN